MGAVTLSTAQIREVDRVAIEEFGMNSLVLMENAAIGCVSWLAKRYGGNGLLPRVAILCGTGNNGGDGLAIARHLHVMGWPCTVLSSGSPERFSPDAKSNYEVLVCGDQLFDVCWPTSSDEIADALDGKDLILDWLLGTGAAGAPRAPMDELIRAANRTAAVRIAVDIPTGVNSETGE